MDFDKAAKVIDIDINLFSFVLIRYSYLFEM